ncbi:S1 RNA-binding domain-containing protein [Moorellaceae bacterium AZ2]
MSIAQFLYDPWPDIYASRQNSRVFLEVEGIGLENHTIPVEGELKELPCLIVSFHPNSSVYGFLPLDYSGARTVNQLRKLIGQKLMVRVVAIDRENEIVVVNRKLAMEEQAKETWEGLTEGEVRPAIIRGINWKYAVLELGIRQDGRVIPGGVEADLTREEASWAYVDDLREYFRAAGIRAGDTIDVKITGLDKEKGEVKVSLKALLPSPWPEAARRFREGGQYMATVSGIEEYGIFVNLPMPGVSALCPQPPREEVRRSIKKGDRVLVTIRKVYPDKQRILAVVRYPVDATVLW